MVEALKGGRNKASKLGVELSALDTLQGKSGGGAWAILHPLANSNIEHLENLYLLKHLISKLSSIKAQNCKPENCLHPLF